MLSIFGESVQQSHLADALKKNNPLLISLCHFLMSAYLLARRHCLLPSSCGTSCGTSCTVCLPSFPRCTLLAQPPPDILRHASTVTHSQRIPNAYDNQVPWRIHTQYIKKMLSMWLIQDSNPFTFRWTPSENQPASAALDCLRL